MVLFKSLIMGTIISTIYDFAHTSEEIISKVVLKSPYLNLEFESIVLLYWVLPKADFNSSDSIAGCRGVCVFSDPVLATCLDYSWNLQPDVVPDSSLWKVCFYLWIWVDFIPHICIQFMVSSSCHVILGSWLNKKFGAQFTKTYMCSLHLMTTWFEMVS